MSFFFCSLGGDSDGTRRSCASELRPFSQSIAVGDGDGVLSPANGNGFLCGFGLQISKTGLCTIDIEVTEK